MIVGLSIRYCSDCNCAYPPVLLICPGCGEERDLQDAGVLIENLAEKPFLEEEEGQLAMVAGG
jgi:hypothetical protein